MRARALERVAFLAFAGLLGPLPGTVWFAATAVAADQPLSQDDAMLLVMSGASTEKKVSLIEQRRVDFQMNSALEKQFKDVGADTTVIDALRGLAPSQLGHTGALSPNPADSSVLEPARQKSGSLPHPIPSLVNKIINEFARKDRLLMEVLTNYAYHQLYKLEEIGENGETLGTHREEWDIVFGDRGERITRLTYAPRDTLKRVYIPAADELRNPQPLMIPPEDLPFYEIQYLDHVRLDEVHAYVFSVRPRQLEPLKLYFQGKIWVEDQDLQIVKAEGQSVQAKTPRKSGVLFPHFTTYREQIDGKYWFPALTLADDILFFPEEPIHVRSVVKYSDYKRFESEVRIVSVANPNDPATISPSLRPGQLNK